MFLMWIVSLNLTLKFDNFFYVMHSCKYAYAQCIINHKENLYLPYQINFPIIFELANVFNKNACISYSENNTP